MRASLTAHKWKQSLEDNLVLALASTSVLLLDPHRYSNEIKPFFGQDDWWAINDHIQRLYDIKRLPLPLTTTTNFLSIIEQLLNDDIDRDASEIQLKTMALQAKEKRMAKALANLVSKLPFVALDEDINETELCSRFVEPFLAGLFDDPAKGIFLRWTNEPKPAAHSNDNYLVCKDLIKVAIFCKEALDKQSFEGILGIQVIGRMVVFYLLTLPSQGLYTLIPLASIKIPDSIQSLPALVTDTPAILKVLDVFDRLCVRAACPSVISDRCAPTLPINNIQQLFSMSKSRKRQCVLQQRHN
ncbi:hypothetical protein BDB00DRAFT_900797 [Zychaea mexicana]|uniref:uncharacterized protein n=1 Tax=Zychaea mexicana TaxID=64656 RepID=UPI0022FF0EB3|nr:uncharacterized protein BDB00DRAFT_900797 [Zychaea mexicana]KAI9495051.1 hypothetical protein BDB00DRAFT_900797 [Zychaea mexicana]